MEYYKLVVRTQVPGYVDAAGGIHIEGFPQLVELKKFGSLSKLVRRFREFLTGKPTDRRNIKREKGLCVFSDEFMIEVPLDVDVSAITGVKWGGKFKMARPQNIDEHVVSEVV